MVAKILVFLVLITLTFARHITINFGKEDFHFNPEYLDNSYISVSPLNEEKRVYNMTLNVLRDIDRDFVINVNVLKLKENGTYKLMYVEENLDFCYLLENNKYGLGDLISASDKSLCPINKGTYVVTNSVLEPLSIPSYVPLGKYIIHVEMLAGGTEINNVVVYGTVTD